MDKPQKMKSKKLWVQLEKLAMQYLKSIINKQFPINETLTEPSKDGGYDGELIIYLCSNGDLEHKILMEAKLRSNSSVPLNDFSKAAIISFNRAANSLYLFTNSHFSPQLVNELDLFKNKINMKIVYVDNDKLYDFIQDNPSLKDTFDDEFLKLFRKASTPKTSIVAMETSCSSEVPAQDISNPVLIEKEKKQETFFCGVKYKEGSRALSELLINSNVQLFLIKGIPGSGKTTFILESLQNVYRPHCVCSIDLSECFTIRLLFIRILESIYGRDLSGLFVSQNVDVTVREIFGEINAEKTSQDDLMVLCHIFMDQHDDLMKHQDMYKFSLAKILYNLLSAHRENSLFIFYFQNIRDSKADVMDFMNQVIVKASQAGAKAIIESQDVEVTPFSSALARLNYIEYTLTGFIEEDIEYCVDSYWSNEPERVRKILINQIKLGEKWLPFEVFNYMWFVRNKTSAGQDLFQALDEIEEFMNFGDGNWTRLLFIEKEYDRDLKECFALAMLLNGRLKLTVLEEMFASRIDIDLLEEKLERTNLFDFHPGYFQVKNKYCYDEISNTVSQTALYKAANLLLNHLDAIEDDYQARILIEFRLLKVGGRFQEMLDAYQQVYDILFSENQYHTALDYLKDCEDAYSRTDGRKRNYKVFADILLKKLDCFYNLYMYQQECYHSTLKQLETVLNLNKDFKAEFVQFLYYKWKTYFTKGDYHYAMTVALQNVEAENLLEGPRDKLIVGKSYVAWALTVKEAEGYNKALEIFQDGLKKYPQSLWLSVEYHSHVACMNLNHNPANSVVHFKKILTITEHTKFSYRDILHARIDISMALYYAKEYEESLLLAEEALDIAESLNFINERGRVLNIIGCCHLLSNQSAEAETYLRESAYLLRKCNAYIYKWRPLINLVNIYNNRGDIVSLENIARELRDEYWAEFVKKLNGEKYEDKLFESFQFLFKLLQSKSPILYKDSISQLQNKFFEKKLDEMNDPYHINRNLTHICEDNTMAIAILG